MKKKKSRRVEIVKEKYADESSVIQEEPSSNSNNSSTNLSRTSIFNINAYLQTTTANLLTSGNEAAGTSPTRNLEDSTDDVESQANAPTSESNVNTSTESIEQMKKDDDTATTTTIIMDPDDDEETGSISTHNSSSTEPQQAEDIQHCQIEAYYSARKQRRQLFDSPNSSWLNKMRMLCQRLPPLLLFPRYYMANLRTDVEFAKHTADENNKGDNSRVDQEENEEATSASSWKEFEASQISKRSKPYFMCLMILVCTALMVVTIYQSHWKLHPINQDPGTVYGDGLLYTPLLLLSSSYRDWYRLATANFLHASIPHLVSNIIFLWWCGFPLERTHGSIKVACLLLAAMIGGSLVSAVFLTTQATVGASGAVFGLLGIKLADIGTNWSLLKVSEKPDNNNEDGTAAEGHGNVRLLLAIVYELVVLIALGFLPEANQFSHIGGLFFGFCFAGICMGYLNRPGSFGQPAPGWNVSWRLACLVIGIASFVALIVILCVNKHGYIHFLPCPQCAVLTCVPFPFWTEDKWWECEN